MVKFLRNEVIARILDIGLIPTFYEDDVEVAKKVILACAEGGAKVVEFTNRGMQAYQKFSELIKWRNKELPEIVLGAGTVIEPSVASLYINCGADFIVSPTFNKWVARICNKYKILYIPGCCTPTEITLAEEMGAEIVKVFPADVVGAQFIKDVLGPMPWSKLMPSGGVEPTRESITKWIKAGASALNIGSNLIRKDLVKEGRFDEIKRMVENCLVWIKEARASK
jgi:2-dehydro-3-deoxyphosphogluconate aldolase/(4S)-4-hydroxy-2-oxoglutarate aldolase